MTINYRYRRERAEKEKEEEERQATGEDRRQRKRRDGNCAEQRRGQPEGEEEEEEQGQGQGQGEQHYRRQEVMASASWQSHSNLVKFPAELFDTCEVVIVTYYVLYYTIVFVSKIANFLQMLLRSCSFIKLLQILFENVKQLYFFLV